MPAPSLDLDWEQGAFRALRALWRRLVPERAELDGDRAAVLAPLARRLSVLASLVAGEPLRVLPAAGAGGLRGDDVLMPPHLDLAPDPEANAALYVLRAVVAGSMRQDDLHEGTVEQSVERAVRRLSTELPAFLPAWDAACLLQDAAGVCVLWGPVYTLSESRGSFGDDDPTSRAAPTSDAEVLALEDLKVHQLDEEEALQLPSHAFEKVETAESFTGTMRQLDGEDDLDDQLEALEEVNFGDLLRGGPQAHSLLRADISLDADIPDVSDVHDDEPHVKYDEWSVRRGRYLPQHCRVFPTSLHRGDPAWGAQRKQAHRRTITRLLGELQRHRDRLRGAPRQLDGEAVDIDALAQAWATLKAGRTPSPRLYTRQTRQQRDVATLVLLDVSLSTDAWVGPRRIERNELVENVVAHVGKAHDEAVDNLQDKQEHAGGEEGPSDLPGLVL